MDSCILTVRKYVLRKEQDMENQNKKFYFLYLCSFRFAAKSSKNLCSNKVDFGNK